MDLADLASVKKAAETFNASSSRLDILMNNAGIMAGDPGLTKDGFEIQFGTNHVGHALLTKLLLPTLQETAKQPGSDVRIINVSSRANKWAPKEGLLLDETLNNDLASLSSFTRYGNSKIANIFYTQELARRYSDIKSVSLHPGDVNTNLIQRIKKSYSWVPNFAWSTIMSFASITVEQGTLNQLWASVSPDAKSGMYYDPVGKTGSVSPFVEDESFAPRLWEWTEKELEKRGY